MSKKTSSYRKSLLAALQDKIEAKSRLDAAQEHPTEAAIKALKSIDLFGAMRGTVTVAPGVDLIDPTGESWDAEK